LVTLAFFPDGFFLDGDLRDAAFLRGAADLARFLVEAFLAAIFCSCRSEKNAGLYIDCSYMEARKQGFFEQSPSAGNWAGCDNRFADHLGAFRRLKAATNCRTISTGALTGRNRFIERIPLH
jgi:hypothetical protein